MPSSIPYDPSLTLASVVRQDVFNNAKEIANSQTPVTEAEESLNSLISSRRELEMTRTELRNLGVETTALDAELAKLNDSIRKSEASYAAAKVAAAPKIQKLRQDTSKADGNIESPVDYNKTGVKSMPFGPESINTDVQYFEFDPNSQDRASFSTQVASYVSKAATSIFGESRSMKMTTAVEKQILQKAALPTFQGTLVLSITCTHKNATVLAPFILNVDKAIKLWNSTFPGKKLDTTNREDMMKIAMLEEPEHQHQPDKSKLSIISGITFGSAIVAMVHVLDSTDASIERSLTSVAKSLQASMESHLWKARSEDSFGGNEKITNDLRTILTKQNIGSQTTLISMGMNTNDGGHATLEQPDDFNSAKEVAHGVTSPLAVHGNLVRSLNEPSSVPDGNGKGLGIDDMLQTVDEYLKQVSKSDCGVPINYYLKDIDQQMLAEMWLAKYYPGQYTNIRYDDTEAAPKAEVKPSS